MKTQVNWNQGMEFTGTCDQNRLQMDAKPPLEKANGFTPKELVAVGVSGCTAMDVVALLKKFKQELQSLDVNAEITGSKGSYPEVFTHIHLDFKARGTIEAPLLMKAIQLSQTQYCGVSAMLVKSAEISYDVFLNDEKIGTGKADFTQPKGA